MQISRCRLEVKEYKHQRMNYLMNKLNKRYFSKLQISWKSKFKKRNNFYSRRIRCLQSTKSNTSFYLKKVRKHRNDCDKLIKNIKRLWKITQIFTKLNQTLKIKLLSQQLEIKFWKEKFQNLPEKIEQLEQSNKKYLQEIEKDQEIKKTQQQQIEQLQNTLTEIEQRLPLAQLEYKSLVEKDKNIIQENKKLNQQYQEQFTINNQLLSKNEELNSELTSLKADIEQSDMKKNIFYQKKINEYESRILVMTEESCQLQEENQKLNQSLKYMNGMEKFFDKNFSEKKSDHSNSQEQQLSEKVKILAKQLEIQLKNKNGMQNRITELEEFIMMLLDENYEDNAKANLLINLGNKKIQRSDILQNRCQVCQAPIKPEKSDNQEQLLEQTTNQTVTLDQLMQQQQQLDIQQ
eukprot:TRINITY_DN9862_c0_g1_i1.p1 TRINITY_DN9862_c0_g1~~TRINITY_DN9862_c0_g1_i1.p1  ORF type:complete len:406 (+),score=89.84 TRINITY_DN9862_c0_g1_i1:832-2049(+)